MEWGVLTQPPTLKENQMLRREGVNCDKVFTSAQLVRRRWGVGGGAVYKG